MQANDTPSVERGQRVFAGGCLCGAVRYEIRPCRSELKALHCHCALCRRSSGAAVMTWVECTPEEFFLVKGGMRTYRSSAHGERRFCGRCGTQIVYHGILGGIDDFGITLGSLDDPSCAKPQMHIWGKSGVPGIEIDPGLERHDGETEEFRRLTAGS